MDDSSYFACSLCKSRETAGFQCWGSLFAQSFICMQVKWGDDLGSEHERYIAEEVYHQPTIVYNYPAEIKAFYMRMNNDGRTVAAMDVLVPGVGELIGGSQREERLLVRRAGLTYYYHSQWQAAVRVHSHGESSRSCADGRRSITRKLPGRGSLA